MARQASGGGSKLKAVPIQNPYQSGAMAAKPRAAAPTNPYQSGQMGAQKPVWTSPYKRLGPAVPAPKAPAKEIIYNRQGTSDANYYYSTTQGDVGRRGLIYEPIPDNTNSGGGSGGRWYGGGGGGGGGTPAAPAEITWSEFDSGIANKPTWWKALKPSEVSESTNYLAAMNLLIPFLSPEDQKTMAANLYAQDAKNFGHLKPEGITSTAPNLTTETERQFLSSERAANALAALEKYMGAVGKQEADMGTGYRYLRSILDAGKQFGLTPDQQSMTRLQYQNMLGALDPLVAQTKGDQLGAYGPLVQALTKPYFTSGTLMPVTKDQSGKYSFGNVNKSLL